MSFKKGLASILSYVLLITCISVPASAVGPTLSIDAQFSSVVARASESIHVTVSANKVSLSKSIYSLEMDDTVSINCNYSPKSADIDIGSVDSEGSFYYVSGSDGSINKSIRISDRSTYTLAIRNNSSTSVTVTGIINY